MVEICVAVADSTYAHGLMRGLAELFDRSSVSFDRTRGEVRVFSEWESRTVASVLKVVEDWMASERLLSATLAIGDRSQTVIGPGHAA